MASDSRTYEMLWDCEFCGTGKLLGKTHRHCPSCGGAQDPARRYFPSEEEKVAVEDHRYVGSDLHCPACQVANSRSAKHCTTCGFLLEGSGGRGAVRRNDQVPGTGGAFSAETVGDARREHGERMAPRAAGLKAQAASGLAPAGGLRYFKWGCGTFLVLAAGFLALVILDRVWKKTAQVTVEGHRWERAITIEQLGPKHESAWCDSMPRDAYEVRRSREVRSTRRISAGEDCTTRRVDNGDGTFTERQECRERYTEEPIYADKCAFSVDRWQPVRTVDARGGNLEDRPRWPEARLARPGACRGCEREGQRTERYLVILKDAGNSFECGFPETRWASFATGSTLTIEKGGLTGRRDCESLRP